MNLFRLLKKCRHDWEYSHYTYKPEMTRTCRKCGLTEEWKEAHMGSWEPARDPIDHKM